MKRVSSLRTKKFVPVVTGLLVALTGAMGLWSTGCGGGLDTPEGVQVNVLRVLDSFDNEISTNSVNTEWLPTSFRVLVASSQSDYGLVATAANDQNVLSHGTFSPNPTPGQTVVVGGYSYICQYGYPYVLWVRSDILGSASFTKDGERNQYWLGVTEPAAMMLVSVAPSGATVGAPRKFNFSTEATTTLTLVYVGVNYVVIHVLYAFDGGWEFPNIPDGGVVLVDQTTSITVGVVYRNGVIFGDGFTQVAATIPAGQTVLRLMYFDVGNQRYYINVYVMGTGGGGGGNQLPVVNMSLTIQGLTLTGDASGSVDLDGIRSYEWTFGDGTTGTGPRVTHTYTANGTYTVTLTVTDNQGGTTTRTATVTVSGGGGGGGDNQLPRMNMFVQVQGRTVSCSANGSYDPDGTLTGIEWDFGDGTTVSGTTSSHTYGADGSYTITLTLMDNRGGTTAGAVTVYVSDEGGPGTGGVNVTIEAYDEERSESR